jgi:hypothetical protein
MNFKHGALDLVSIQERVTCVSIVFLALKVRSLQVPAEPWLICLITKVPTPVLEQLMHCNHSDYTSGAVGTG